MRSRAGRLVRSWAGHLPGKITISELGRAFSLRKTSPATRSSCRSLVTPVRGASLVERLAARVRARIRGHTTVVLDRLVPAVAVGGVSVDVGGVAVCVRMLRPVSCHSGRCSRSCSLSCRSAARYSCFHCCPYRSNRRTSRNTGHRTQPGSKGRRSRQSGGEALAVIQSEDAKKPNASSRSRCSQDVTCEGVHSHLVASRSTRGRSVALYRPARVRKSRLARIRAEILHRHRSARPRDGRDGWAGAGRGASYRAMRSFRRR